MTDPFDWGLLEPLGASAVKLAGDDAVLTALVEVERALVRAWAGVVDQDLGLIAASLDAASVDRAALLSGARSGGVPIIPLVSQLRAQADTVHAGGGSWVHRGATSQDILDTGLILLATRTLETARSCLREAGMRVAALTRAERDVVVTVRTLSQPAQASTLGAQFAGWLDGITAAMCGIDATIFPVQLGGAVGTGRAFVEAAGSRAPSRLRAGLAEQLGLDDPGRSWHTERSALLAIAGTASLVVAACGRIGRDLGLAARDGLLVPAHGGGSSAMSHKNNPVDAVLLTANGLRAPGLLATVHFAALSYDARPAGEWHAEWQAMRALLRLSVESADALLHGVEDIQVHRRQPRADDGNAAAGQVADAAIARFENAVGGAE